MGLFISYDSKISDIVIFDGVTNVKLVGSLLNMHYPKLIVMRGVEHTVSLLFNDVSKIPVVNKMISAHKIIHNFLVLAYITSLILYLNANLKSFTIETLVYLVKIRLEWLDISWEFTETCVCGNIFKPPYHLLNSSVFLLITNSPNKLGTFMTISHGKGDM